jgi:ABC-type branched-subunit amino acid transport system permease subunit
VIDYIVSALTVGAILGILTLGLNVRWGWAGELDLAYYAFVALGAYVGAVLQLPHSQEPGGSGWILGLQLPFWVGLLGGAVVSTVASLLVGALALRRLRGDYLAITTVAFSLVVAAVLSQEKGIFNGFNGVYGLPQPYADVLNLDPATYSKFFLGMCVAILGIVYLVLELLYRSPFGRTLRAIREDETAAAAFGRNIFAEKLKAYVIGGACAGIGGVLFAQFLSAWNPYSWATIETFLLYSAIFLGGQANGRGVLLGTLVVLVAVPEVTRFLPAVPGHPDLFPALRNIVSGILVLAVLRWRPQGILPERRPRDHRPAPGVASPGAVAPTAHG